jgi:8-hydroxy-5-deazaflavin:NADPH oxidoreductase
MNVAVLGTGIVGRTIAGKLSELGHVVVVGTRDPEATIARTDADAMGNPPYSAWQAEHPAVRLAPFAEAGAFGELVVLATNGSGSLDALTQAGEENLAGKVLLDVSNPLDSTSGFPPQLFVQGDDSLAETIQRAHPDAKVVKSLNTMNNRVMADPQRLGEETSVFVSGDDADAKALVIDLLRSMGHGDVIDLGGLETARGAEMWLPLWVRLAVALGGSDFNIKVVRGPALDGGGGG